MQDNIIRPDFSSSYDGSRDNPVVNGNNVIHLRYYDPNKELFDMVNNKRKEHKPEYKQQPNVQARKRNTSTNRKKKKIKGKAGRVGSLLLSAAIGLGAITATANIANYIKRNNEDKEQSLQQAIIQAKNDDDWFEQNFISEENSIENMNKLEEAIAQYGEFKNNPELKKSNRETYIETCNEILKNKDFISTQYTNAIENEIAKLYNLNIEEAREIDILYVMNKNTPTGARISFSKDRKKVFIDENPTIGEKKMSKELAQAVADARKVKDIEADLDKAVDEGAVEDVIRAYGSMEKFAKADISLDENGNIVVQYDEKQQLEANKIDDERE